jgi:hypothetical protein
MTLPNEYDIRGIDAGKWVIFCNGLQLPNLEFGSRIEAEIGLEAEIQYWNTIPKDVYDNKKIYY